MQQFFRLRRRWWTWWIWEPPLPVALSYTYISSSAPTLMWEKLAAGLKKNCFYQENMVLQQRQQQQAVCRCPGVPPFENQCLPSWTIYSGLTYMSKGWSCDVLKVTNHKLFFKKRKKTRPIYNLVGLSYIFLWVWHSSSMFLKWQIQT